MDKRCPDCEKTKSVDCFGKDAQKKDGLRTYCIDCMRAKYKPKKGKEIRDRWAKANPSSVMYSNAKQRAKRQRIPFDIEVKDIIIPTHCPILGIELKQGIGTQNTTSPSLDKIIPELGYVKGNVKVISGKANIMKGELTLETLELLKVYIKENTNG